MPVGILAQVLKPARPLPLCSAVWLSNQGLLALFAHTCWEGLEPNGIIGWLVGIRIGVVICAGNWTRLIPP